MTTYTADMPRVNARVFGDDLARSLGRLIGERAQEIERRWLERVIRDVEKSPGVELTHLRAGMSDYLNALHRLLAGGGVDTSDAGAKIWLGVARDHGITRVRIGFDVDQLIRELVVLRHTIRELAEEHGMRSADVDHVLGDLIDEAIKEAVKAYVEARNFETRRAQAQNIGFLTHELRNPLSAAIQAAELIRDQVPPEYHRAVEVLDRSHARLIALIDGVLDAERLEAGTIEPKKVEVHEGELMARATEAAHTAARLKGIEFRLEHVPERVLLVDPDLTASALQNLIDNAVKYTDSGKVEVIVTHQPDGWMVHVHDTCHGLSPEELRTIFEPFRRGATSKPGTGLGLAIAKRAIEAQGGTIQAESCDTVGCHFWIKIPQA